MRAGRAVHFDMLVQIEVDERRDDSLRNLRTRPFVRDDDYIRLLRGFDAQLLAQSIDGFLARTERTLEPQMFQSVEQESDDAARMLLRFGRCGDALRPRARTSGIVKRIRNWIENGLR